MKDASYGEVSDEKLTKIKMKTFFYFSFHNFYHTSRDEMNHTHTNTPTSLYSYTTYKKFPLKIPIK